MQDSEPTPERDGRWELLRDLAKFQLKLLIDGLRDLLMSPVSLIAGIAGLLVEPRDPGRYFHRALDFGRRTEHWINLFGRIPHEDEEPGIDELFLRLESKLVEQAQHGGLTSGAKRAVDGSLDRLHTAVAAVRRRAAGKNAESRDQSAGDTET